jgi:hypothetical protein
VPAKQYDWDVWFRRRKFTLRRWEHYHCSPVSMAQQIRNEASKRGFKVHVITDQSDQFTVVVRSQESDRAEADAKPA